MIMNDRHYDGVIYALSRVAIVALIVMLMSRLYGCGENDKSISDCSQRGRPQHYDGGRWTCDERGQR